jgi:hypothetical protein
MDKAYCVFFKDEEWCDYVHAKNSKGAIKQLWDEWGGPISDYEYIDCRAVRVPELDNKSLMGINIIEINPEWTTMCSSMCKCEICRGA